MTKTISTLSGFATQCVINEVRLITSTRERSPARIKKVQLCQRHMNPAAPHAAGFIPVDPTGPRCLIHHNEGVCVALWHFRALEGQLNPAIMNNPSAGLRHKGPACQIHHIVGVSLCTRGGCEATVVGYRCVSTYTLAGISS